MKSSQLVEAARTGDEESVTRLLQQEVDAGTVNLGLMFSALYGHDNLVRIFHEHGGDVNERSWKKMTPLIASAMGGHLTTTILLLDLGAEINLKDADGETALLKAVKGGHSEVANELKTRGADESIQNANGDTVQQLSLNRDLIAASTAGEVESVNSVMQQGASVHSTDGYGHMGIHLSAEHGHDDIVKIIRLYQRKEPSQEMVEREVAADNDVQQQEN